MYVTDGWFSGGLTAGVVRSGCWRVQFGYFNEEPFILDRTLYDVAFYGWFNCLKTYWYIICRQLSMFMFRTYGEHTY